MDATIIKSDIFFLITTIAVIIISIGLAVALFYIIRVFKDLSILSKKTKEEGEKILEDVRIMREATENKGVSLITKLYPLFSFFNSKSKPKTTVKKPVKRVSKKVESK